MLFGGVGGGVLGKGSGSRYADIICKFCTRKVTFLPFMNAEMLCMSSHDSIKRVQVICILYSLTDYDFNT